MERETGRRHVFLVTPDHTDYNWAARADMDANLRPKLADAFLSPDQHTGLDKEILERQHASRLIPASAGNHTAIEASALNAGF